MTFCIVPLLYGWHSGHLSPPRSVPSLFQEQCSMHDISGGHLPHCGEPAKGEFFSASLYIGSSSYTRGLMHRNALCSQPNDRAGLDSLNCNQIVTWQLYRHVSAGGTWWVSEYIRRPSPPASITAAVVMSMFRLPDVPRSDLILVADLRPFRPLAI